MAAAVIGIAGTCFGYVIPELFNRHSTTGDLLALLVASGAAAFVYLVGRYVWRSFRITNRGDEE